MIIYYLKCLTSEWKIDTLQPSVNSNVCIPSRMKVPKNLIGHYLEKGRYGREGELYWDDTSASYWDGPRQNSLVGRREGRLKGAELWSGTLQPVH